MDEEEAEGSMNEKGKKKVKEKRMTMKALKRNMMKKPMKIRMKMKKEEQEKCNVL